MRSMTSYEHQLWRQSFTNRLPTHQWYRAPALFWCLRINNTALNSKNQLRLQNQSYGKLFIFNTTQSRGIWLIPYIPSWNGIRFNLRRIPFQEGRSVLRHVKFRFGFREPYDGHFSFSHILSESERIQLVAFQPLSRNLSDFPLNIFSLRH